MTASAARQVAQAIRSSVEDDVPEPTRRRSGSFAAAIIDLAVGETASRAQRIEGNLTLDEMAAQFAARRENLRNVCAPSMRQARNATGGEYTIEIADCMTPGRAVFIVALVTRTA